MINDAEVRMGKSLDSLIEEYNSLRAGRANPALVEDIQIDYYGTMTPLNQVSNISVPEARLIVVQPWDKTVVPLVEKAILKSDLDLNPNNDGTVIRLTIPQLTEERRKELVKVVRAKAEEARVAIRNIRRDVNDQIKAEEKNKTVSEDESRMHLEKCQEITDENIEKVDKMMEDKEKEIMEI